MPRHLCTKPKTCNRGFSLVELSIVLLIVGLLVGGVLAGQTLLRAAEIRSVGADLERFAAAAINFKEKYEAIPGDMPGAVDAWGAAHATPATCYSTASTGKATCNGNGDGLVTVVPNVSNEPFRFWQQLSAAGYIEGQYTGIESGSVSTAVGVGINVPESRIENSGYHVTTLNNYAGDSVRFALDYDINMLYGGQVDDSSNHNFVLTAQEALGVDSKLDDGKPSYGKLVAGQWDSCTDATSETDTASPTYQLGSNNKICILFYRQFIR